MQQIMPMKERFTAGGALPAIALASLAIYTVTRITRPSRLPCRPNQPAAQDAMGRARPPGHLVQGGRYSVGATRQLTPTRRFSPTNSGAEIDRQISDIISRDSTEAAGRAAPSETSIPNSAQAPFTVHLPTGKRTSLIVDPPDGRIPPLTPEAQKARDALRQFQLALLQPTAACKENHPGCAGGEIRTRVTETERDASDVRGGVGWRDINRADGPRTVARASAASAVPFRISVI